MNGGGCKINIGKSAIGLLFGMPALERISDKFKKLDVFSGATYSLVAISHVLYAGYLNNCMVKDIDHSLDFETFYNHIEESAVSGKFPSDVYEAIKEFENSKYVKGAADSDDEKKSPLTGKKSKNTPMENLALHPANTAE